MTGRDCDWHSVCLAARLGHVSSGATVLLQPGCIDLSRAGAGGVQRGLVGCVDYRSSLWVAGVVTELGAVVVQRALAVGS